MSSSLLQPRRPWRPPPHQLATPLGVDLPRKALSSSALLRHPHRRRSCLRKSRYSCPAMESPPSVTLLGPRLHRGLRNEGRVELAKSVSFYSEVSVFEFAVVPDQRRSQKGWSRYFTE